MQGHPGLSSNRHERTLEALSDFFPWKRLEQSLTAALLYNRIRLPQRLAALQVSRIL